MNETRAPSAEIAGRTPPPAEPVALPFTADASAIARVGHVAAVDVVAAETSFVGSYAKPVSKTT